VLPGDGRKIVLNLRNRRLQIGSAAKRSSGVVKPTQRELDTRAF
jgi:hypothetical protein